MTENYNLFNDEKLAELAQAGDETAEEVLINRYKELVKSRAHMYFIAGADAEDVIQEGMIGLFKAVRDYCSDRDTLFRTFAAVCINRQIITAIKTAKRMKHGPLNNSISLNRPLEESGGEKDVIENILAAPVSNPEEMILIQDTIDEITSAMSQILSKFELQVWQLYISGQNYTDIAEKTGKSPKSIDNALQRIKRKIAAEYY